MSGVDLRAPRRPPVAAALLERELAAFRGDLTTADAAARTGLALVDAEGGLRLLASRRGGHLKATDAGEIVYSFPDGLTRRRAGLGRRFLRGAARVLESVGRFVVRAWVSVVLVGYAALFVGVAIALASSRDDRDDGVGGAIALVGRVLIDALYWTFHPFSPVAMMALEPGWGGGYSRRAPRLAFYERVNRFVFGPPQPGEDLRGRERALLAEIRRLEGRIGPSDLMRVTGADRQDAERELLRLVVEYDGDVHAADGEGAGAVVYSFAGMRSTAASPAAAPQAPRDVAPCWSRSVSVPPLTGNGVGTNVLLGALNGFNLAASGAAVAYGMTLERLGEVIAHARAEATFGTVLPPLPPAHGVPLLLGWIPLVFSTALFALPLTRALRRRRAVARAAAENGRRALLRVILETIAGGGAAEISAADARRVWDAAAGPAGRGRTRAKQIEEAVRALGGDIDITDDGAIIYRFDAAAREERALVAARAGASRAETSPGRVVFASSAPGSGELD